MIVLSIHVYLVSMCKRLSAIQDLAWVLRICAQNSEKTLFLADQAYPRLELLLEDLVSLGLRLVKNTPPLHRIGTSHGGLSKFESEVGQEYAPKMKTSGLMCRELVCWRLIAVSPTDTIYLYHATLVSTSFEPHFEFSALFCISVSGVQKGISQRYLVK